MYPHGKTTTFFRQVAFSGLVGFFVLFLVLLILGQANPLRTKLERDSGIYLLSQTALAAEGGRR